MTRFGAETIGNESRDPRAWARRLLERHSRGIPVAHYALECAREALRGSPHDNKARGRSTRRDEHDEDDDIPWPDT